MSYLAEINNGTVVRVIVAESEQWCVDNLGGTWVETADPYADPTEVVYAGPGYGCDETFPERFAPPWQTPAPDIETGVWSSYPKGVVVAHAGSLWRSTMDGNVWEPGVSAWHPESDIEGVLPDWVQPTGAHDVWPLDAEVTHAGKRWRSLVPANVWEPGTNATLWLDLDAPTVAAWVQPTGTHNAYPIGAEVTHNGSTWRSTAANNVWEPGTFGWTVN